MTKGGRQKINTVEMDALQSGCRVSRLDNIRNTEIMDIIGKVEATVEEIEKRRLVW